MNDNRKLHLGCSCMTLTSASGKHYLFRTCDLDENSNKESFQPVTHEKNKEIIYSDGSKEICHYNISGISYTNRNTWLLDGINEAGLCGALLMLSEGTSIKSPVPGKKGCMGMEVVTKLLSCCKNIHETETAAKQMQLTDIVYGQENLKASVHFFFCDLSGEQLILEATNHEQPGIFQIYKSEDILGVMTNSPPYPIQKENLWKFLVNSPIFQSDKGKTMIQELEFDKKKLDLKSLSGKISETDPLYNKHLEPAISPYSSTYLSPIDFFTLPGGYSSWERFIRIALFKALNNSGHSFLDEKMLALGTGIMNTVREPSHKGFFHLSFDESSGICCPQDSKTHYLVMYDLSGKKFHLQAYDDTLWKVYLCNGSAPDQSLADLSSEKV